MHLLGFRFAPRIRDLSDKRLFVAGKQMEYPSLAALIGGTINVKHIRTHWDEIPRLATSIRQGTVTASLMLRKLGSYPRQNRLAVALRELGRIERSLFTLNRLQNVELRRRVHPDTLRRGECSKRPESPSFPPSDPVARRNRRSGWYAPNPAATRVAIDSHRIEPLPV